MYLTLPGEMGYAQSWDFVNQLRRTLELSQGEARELLRWFLQAEERFCSVDALPPEQKKIFKHYAETTEELLMFYDRYGEEPVDEESTDAFVMFSVMLLYDQNFHGMVEAYARRVSEELKELIRSSTKRQIHVRGAEELISRFVVVIGAVQAVHDELGYDEFMAYDTLDDLFI